MGMRNIDRAAQVIHEYLHDHTLTRDAGNPHSLAQALKDAGLLMPDLQEPTPSKYDPSMDPYWKVRLKQGAQTTVLPSYCDLISVTGLGIADVTGARALALALLAAANYAEEKK